MEGVQWPPPKGPCLVLTLAHAQHGKNGEIRANASSAVTCGCLPDCGVHSQRAWRPNLGPVGDQQICTVCSLFCHPRIFNPRPLSL